MSLISRLVGPDADLPVHAFNAAVRQWIKGNVQAGMIVTRFSLSTEDTAEVQAIRTKINAGAYSREDFMDWMDLGVHDIVTETELRAFLQIPAPPS